MKAPLIAAAALLAVLPPPTYGQGSVPRAGYGRELVLDFGLGLGLRQNF